jgi:voltage-gated potassium channel
MDTGRIPETDTLTHERLIALRQVEAGLETPMLVLGFAWLVLLLIEFTWGLSSLLQVVSNVIWIIFIVDFLLRFVLAPRKLAYVRANWLTAISLLVPAVRIFRLARVIRVLRLARATRGLQLVRVVSSLNRGMRALRVTLGRRGFGYVAALTILVTLVGAAGMFVFEKEVPTPEGLHTYGSALWWTAMLMTTMGSQYWPQTPEGRVLGFLLALYAFAIFGYVTATLATFFIGHDAATPGADAPRPDSVAALRAEIAALRAVVRALGQRPPGPPPSSGHA